MRQKIILIVSLIILAACGGGGSQSSGSGSGDGTGGDDTYVNSDTDVCGGSGYGCISGSVVDVLLAPIDSVQIKVNNVLVGQSNEKGWFDLSNIAEGDNAICFTVDDYMTTCRRVHIISGEMISLSATILAAQGDPVSIAVIKNGGAAGDSNTGAYIQFPADAICNSSAQIISGDITCRFASIDMTGANSLLSAPASFQTQYDDSENGVLIANAIMAVECYNDSEPVYLCSGKQAMIRVPIYGASACSSNDSRTGWSLSLDTALWENYENEFESYCGGVAPERAGANNYYTGSIDQLATWYAVGSQSQSACLNGSIDAFDAMTYTVRCYGQGWQNDIFSQADSSFCAPVPQGESYTCKVGTSTSWIDSDDFISGTASNSVVDFPVNSCPATDCSDIGTFSFSSNLLSTSVVWGVSPSDLDANLLSNTGTHISFTNAGSITESPYIQLDTDDTDYYGPEIITMTADVANGTYCYYVYQFSDEGNLSTASTDAIGNAITTYSRVIGDGVASTITASDNSNAYDYWRVFSFQVDSGRIKSGSFSIHNDYVSDEPLHCNW